MRKRDYPRDPYFTTARFDSVCPQTGKPLKKGDTIAYFPRERKAYHKDSEAADTIHRLHAAVGLLDENY